MKKYFIYIQKTRVLSENKKSIYYEQDSRKRTTAIYSGIR